VITVKVDPSSDVCSLLFFAYFESYLEIQIISHGLYVVQMYTIWTELLGLALSWSSDQLLNLLVDNALVVLLVKSLQ